MALRQFANGLKRFVDETQRVTEGFEDVFGEDMTQPADDVRRDRLMSRVAADSPSSRGSRMSSKLTMRTRGPDLSFGRGKQEKDNDRRFF